MERVSDVDALMWAIERDPRLRTTIVAVAVFDGPLDRRRLRHRLDRAARLVPRLHRRMVADPRGIAPPTWEVDPDFCLANHLRITALGGQGTRRELHELAAALATVPFDRDRPLWEVTLVEGLAGDASALVLKTHHAVSDGVGGVELAMEVFDLAPEPDPARDHLPPAPTPHTSPADSIEAIVRHEIRAGFDTARRAVDAARAAGSEPEVAARRLGAMVGSAVRQLRPVTATARTNPARSHEVAFDSFTVALDDLRTAGRRVGGTINDAFVTAVALGLATHHRRAGSTLPDLRMAIPVNRRGAVGVDNAEPGNHWTPGVLELALADAHGEHPDEVMRRVRDRMRTLRRDTAHDLLTPLAGLLRRTPVAVTSSLVGAATKGIDVTASNVPGSPLPLYLHGRTVTELVPFGPLSGAATNVTLLGHGDDAHIGINRDPAAVPDGEALTADLCDAFTLVIEGADR